MTSKEALKRISNIDLQVYPDDNDVYFTELLLGGCYREEVEIIKKDLEVVEIFKKYFKFDFDEFRNWYIFEKELERVEAVMCRVTKEENRLLRKWLDE